MKQSLVNRKTFHGWFSAKNILVMLGAALMSSLVFASTHYFEQLSQDRYRSEQRLNTISAISTIRAKLEGTVNGSMALLMGVSAHISTNPNISQEEFVAFTKMLIEDHPEIKNVGAAPNFVIQFVHPLQGNERAIGLNYRKIPAQWDAVKRIIETREMVIAGPVYLIQGGRGFIGRVPVVDPQDPTKLWGLVSGVIDVDKVFALSGLSDPEQDLTLVLQGKDGLGLSGDVIYGNLDQLGDVPVSVDVSITNGNWVLFAQPKKDWDAKHAFTGPFHMLGGALVFLIVGFSINNIYHRRQRHKMTLQLLESEATLNFALEGANAGTWDWQVDRDTIEFSPRAQTMCGYAAGSWNGDMSSWQRLIHPDDVENVVTRLQAQRMGLATVFKTEFRIRTKDNGWKWVLARGKTVSRGDDGNALRVVGTQDDISESVEDAETIARLLEEKSQVLASAGDGIYGIDLQGRTTFVNPEMLRITGWTEAELLNQNQHEMMHHTKMDGSPYPSAECPVHTTLHNGTSQRVEEDVFWRKDGTSFPVEFVSTPIHEDGIVSGAVVVFHDLTKRKENERLLLKAKEEADRANQAKSDFLSSMSHELRTPLNAILGFSQLMEFNPKEPLLDGQKDAVRQIKKGGTYLLELINQVLDLAKIEAGKLDLEIVDCDIRDVIEECVLLAESMAHERGVTIEVEALPHAKTVRADYTRTRQILLNLLSNGVKYNRDDGKLTVKYTDAANGMLNISISDTGIGIPTERRDELFKPFSRLGAETSDIEGTGIGLTITKRLIEAMGGRIGYHSTLNVGSTFWIEIPLSGLASETLNEQADEASSLAGTTYRMAGSVLYIEDNPANIQLMEGILEHIPDIKLDSAHTAELGLASAKMNRPDLILMDINLPGMNGIEAFQELRRRSELSDIPVIAISAAAMPSDIERGLKAGFLAYLTKPFDVAEVLKAVEGVLMDKNA